MVGFHILIMPDTVICSRYIFNFAGKDKSQNGMAITISLIDPMDGSIYSIPEDMIEPDGAGIYLLKNIPVKDYPLILTFGDFI